MHCLLILFNLTLAILQLFLFFLKVISLFITLKIESDNNKKVNNTRVSKKILKMHKEKYIYLLNSMERRWMSTFKKVNLFKKCTYETFNFVGVFHWKFILDTSKLIANFFNSLSVSLCIGDVIADKLG